MASALDAVVTHVRSGAQAMRIVTYEESRAVAMLQAAVKQINELDKGNMQLATWDADYGYCVGKQVGVKPKDPVGAFRAIDDPEGPLGPKGDYLVVMKDMHPFLREPVVQRTFRNRREPNSLNCQKFRRPIVFLTPSDMLPNEIRRSIIDIDFALPDDNDLARIFEYVKKCLPADKQKHDDVAKKRIVAAMRGMTEPEAEEALFYAVYTHKGFKVECADIIEDEKAKVLRSSGVLSYIPKTAIASMDSVGGYTEFAKFIKIRSRLYSDEARELGLRLPKGVVLLGPPGTGKTTVGKIAAKILGLPLVMMDFGSVFGSLVGESEAKMKETLKQVTSLGGAVLLVDDADKAFKNVTASSGDSGVTQRVFQQFLVWRSEYKGPVFVILTMNTTEGIPPELLRPGRFDAVLCSLLPDEKDRISIWTIKMEERQIRPSQYGSAVLADLVTMTEGFSGAEIEGALDEAVYVAFDARQTNVPTVDELKQAVEQTVPVSKRDAATVKALVEYCKTNKLRSVNGETEKTVKTARGRRAIALDGDE